MCVRCLGPRVCVYWLIYLNLFCRLRLVDLRGGVTRLLRVNILSGFRVWFLLVILRVSLASTGSWVWRYAGTGEALCVVASV